ncbi:hypothetical protein Mp_2g13310 [Marchantia polymorpha subsp. ruderalis]|uniref:Urease accessory protein D n=1 Tax=Marchantia polymorpha TaxID=3197 RepID=A0A2R6XAP6_MARPO|nr:hypothetical protein MARPO_0026s0041 [Marchantia polymorpha]BBN02161.1 hypothetical protein Mp_2g13310 [Marchantia polymorpha subsp. ruderalis]|eukprot:PTQ43158.1 hypothetical protein MARPO_0026s0041 [Marchantia polymorpha]
MDVDIGSVSLMDLLLKNQIEGPKLNGSLRVERVYGKSSTTRSYATYPLQFMIPKKALPSHVDAVLVYALTFGGGIVSGDCIFFELNVGADSTMMLLTQGFTNVYKSVEGKMSRHILKCSVESGGLLALLPDSVVCFATARYSQVQRFNLAPDASLVLVDWLTSGRIARGEVWNFEYFKSTNHVYIQEDTPLLLDSVCLDDHLSPSVSERMGDYHVIAMIFIYGPRLAELRKLVQSNVEKLAGGILNNRRRTSSSRADQVQTPKQNPSAPAFLASCSTVGPLGDGLVIRAAATTTRSMYGFLREQLATLEPILGRFPYADN